MPAAYHFHSFLLRAAAMRAKSRNATESQKIEGGERGTDRSVIVSSPFCCKSRRNCGRTCVICGTSTRHVSMHGVSREMDLAEDFTRKQILKTNDGAQQSSVLNTSITASNIGPWSKPCCPIAKAPQEFSERTPLQRVWVHHPKLLRRTEDI